MLLAGRDHELAQLTAFVARAAAGGEALVLAGEPGAGKTTLLVAAAAAASRVGALVVLGAGAEFEAEVSFSGLNQVLQPLLGEFGRLGPAQHGVLEVALGLGNGPPAGRDAVSAAALGLLRSVSSGQPLLVIVDDLQWLDRASAAVLRFAAGRLAGSRAGFLGASRVGREGFFERSGLPGLEVGALDEAAAGRLLSERFPDLVPRVRRRVLAEAKGNPLAILELPAALSGPQRTALAALPAFLPLSGRLQSLYAAQIGQLPALVRHILLIAALDNSGELRVAQAAAGVPDGNKVDADRGGNETVAAAERARLVLLDEDTGRLTFRHPLIRSAMVQMSTADQRRRAHQALAAQLADQPARRAWHLAGAATGPDEQVSALLEEAARWNLGRGDGAGAVVALLRAADLCPTSSGRGRLLAEAAYVGADVTGDLHRVSPLLEEARRADPAHGGALAAAVAASYLLLNGDGDTDTAHRLLSGTIESLAPVPDAAGSGTLTEALHTLLLVCFFGGRSELWRPFHAALARLGPHVPVLLGVQAATFADPARSASGVLAALDGIISGLGDETDQTLIVRAGIGAIYVDRLAGCRAALWRVVRDGQQGGAVTSAINALFLLCADDWMTGRWEEAEQLTAEGLALCESHGYRVLAWPGIMERALIAAARGDFAAAAEMTAEMTRWAAPRKLGAVDRYADHVSALAALGRGDFDRAFRHAAAISPPGQLASHVPEALWVLLDLVEAAVRTGRHDEAAAHVTAMRDAGLAQISPRLALVATGAAAVATKADADARRLFEETMAVPGADRWPFDLARIRLLYGERLRRARAGADARTHLVAARNVFGLLGARPWERRAASELRATGLGMSRSHAFGETELTAQEREIAMLAAVGLSNKQIGQRLFLSYRTVGAHLYRIFPKLGITSRAALRDALAGHGAEQADGARPDGEPTARPEHPES